MSSALRGNLRDFGIAEVFQLIGQQRKTGVLEIDGAAERVRLVFDGGSVVRAEPVTASEDGALADLLLRCGLVTRETLIDLQRDAASSMQRLGGLAVERGVLEAEQVAQVEDLLTQETLFRVLGWEDGSFAFVAQPVEHDRAGRLLAAEQILMDGLRMVDEWKTFADQVPSEETVFQRTGRFEDWLAAQEEAGRELEGRELESLRRVYQLVDGRLPVRRVVDLSRLGTFEATRRLAELRRAGLLEPLDREQVERHRPRAGLELPRTEPRPLLAALLPLVLLAGVAYLALQGPAGTRSADAFPIERDVLAQARSAYATQRVRQALEAFRFAEGRWPTRLEELVEHGLLEPSALAAPGGGAYYYARRGDDAVLLAPEQ